ncbi:MAG: glycosyltransferase, partial [Candidatus Micrarchaeota archaeon]|nr:glycosyltransferase [Candidatus Micrarchaeota archaeon]
KSMVEVLGVPAKNVVVFPAAIDGSEIRGVLRRRFKRSNKFVVVARLVPEKRVEMAIRAIVGTGAELIVIGTGPEEPKLLALARKLGVEKKVRIENIREREAVLRHISEARGMLMFSAREGLSIVSIEALALGTPVIITKSTSLTDEIRRHCHTVDERNLSGSIARLLKN